jgi:hypothetical protein
MHWKLTINDHSSYPATYEASAREILEKIAADLKLPDNVKVEIKEINKNSKNG